MNENRHAIIKVPADLPLTIALSILIVMNYLPIIKIINPVLLSLTEVAVACFVFLLIAQRDMRMFICYVFIVCLAFVINVVAYYKCWINTNSLVAFLIQNCMCWIYMEFGIYLCKYGTKGTKKALFSVIIITMLITCITSIISVRAYPTAMRGLGNGSVDIKGNERYLYGRNTATWSMVFGMTFILPYIIQLFKKTRKTRYLFAGILILYCILRSQITMALLMAAIFVVLVLIKPLPPKKLFIVMLVAIVGGLLFSNYISEIVFWLYQNVFGGNTDTMLGKRFYQLYISMSTMKMIGTYAGRFDLYMTSINAFLKHPLLGISARSGFGLLSFDSLTSIVGMHSQVFDMLAVTGLVGTVPLFGMFSYLVKKMFGMIGDGVERNFFSFTVFMLIFLMFLNPTFYSACVYLVTFCGVSFVQTETDRRKTFVFRAARSAER